MAMTSSYANLFGTTAKPKGQQGFPNLQSDGSASAPSTGTSASRPASPTPGMPQTAMTFAQMQRQGMARPSRNLAGLGGSFATMARRTQSAGMATPRAATPAKPPVLDQIQGILGRNLPSNTSRYDTELFTKLRDLQKSNLEAEYAAQQSALNEDLARRGLSSSSIAAGRFGDLAGQQARAMAGIDADLLERAATTQAADRAARDQMFIQLSQMLATLKPEQIKRLMGG